MRNPLSNISTTDSRHLADHVGTYLSLVCAVHCILTPIAVTLLPLFAAKALLNESFHEIVMGVSVVLSVLSSAWGYRRHRKWHLFLIVVGGIGFLSLSRTVERNEAILAGLGGLLLATGHIVNRRLCEACQECREVHPTKEQRSC